MTYFLLYIVLNPVMRLLIRVLGRLHSSGEAYEPSRGPVIYCPNHVSDADPPTIFVSIHRHAWYVAKNELFEIRGIGWLCRHFHAIPIKRDSADRAALKRAEAVLKRGEALVIFPEGRCSEDGRLQVIQPGAALLSVRTGAPIVPVGLQNTNQIIPYGSVWPRFSRDPVIVAFGPPIDPKSFSSLPHGQAIRAITQTLAAELVRLTHQA